MATISWASPNGYGRAAISGGSRLPPITRTASGFSGRRFCRIFPRDDLWVLQMEQGWAGACIDQSCKTFPTLTAAITYAVAHGLNYRVVYGPTVTELGERRPPLPSQKNSWVGIDGQGAVSNS
jgi:hypothetical protein